MKGSPIPFRRWVSAAIALMLVGQACTIQLFDMPTLGSTPTPGVVIPASTPYSVAPTTFIVTIPEPLQAGESIALYVLDEVTGLALNSTQYILNPRDTLTYTGTVPVPVNSTVKYRYARLVNGTPMMEDTTLGTAIRYRLHNAASSSEVQDIVADWSDKSYTRPTGKIIGQIYNSDTNSPIPSVLVTAGGIQSLTDSQGHFELAGLPVGTHQVAVYSLDGLYLPFQQGAVVADSIPTDVKILYVKPTRLVNVTFRVSVPADSFGRPVRIIGNILQLGNTFADLQGGVSVSADRAYTMELQPDGGYAATIGLPVGTYIEYKYTLGDGYWNAEHDSAGKWVVRKFLVPGQDTTIQDGVETWQVDANSGSILFEAIVPSTTPANDIVYIQFKTFGWMEPIPMWRSGDNRWEYKLYGPLYLNVPTVYYRFCRNGQCSSADDNQTVGDTSVGLSVNTALFGQDIQTNVSSWTWYENPVSISPVGYNITPRAAGFMAGVEYQPTFRPNFTSHVRYSIDNAKLAVGANTVIFTPSWTFVDDSPLKLATQPGRDPLWIDSAMMISLAQSAGLKAAVFPTPQFPPSPDSSISASTQFWRNAPKDAAWWQAWFTQYRAFIVNYADLAAQTGAQTLILGGEWVTPSLPGGLLPDGTSSNVPADAEAQWRAIIQDVRARFRGQLLWAMPYERSSFTAPVSFLRDVDGIYLLWSTPIATSATATKTDYTNEAGRLLDNEVFPLSSLLGNKPIILAVSYPSANGAPNGCVPNGAGGCADFNALSRPNTDISSVSLNLQSQADVYEAILVAVNARSWVSGVVSRGFYMPVALQDKSTSIHGKPASTVLWYWYPRMLGIVR